MTDFPITIFHNPKCGTSRNTLAMIEAAGYAPTVVDYAQAGWTRAQLEGLLVAMDARPADILRAKEPAAQALAPDADDETVLGAMITEPRLVNRPIVVTPKGVKLCRPSEVVFELLEKRPETFTKEDGEVVGRRGEGLRDAATEKRPPVSRRALPTRTLTGEELRRPRWRRLPAGRAGRNRDPRRFRCSVFRSPPSPASCAACR